LHVGFLAVAAEGEREEDGEGGERLEEGGGLHFLD
jgi:hypothetical protein